LEAADARVHIAGAPPRGFRAYVVVVVAALVVYGYTWAVQPGRPQLRWVFREPGALVNVGEKRFDPNPKLVAERHDQSVRYGWNGAWYDQFQYARMARALARGEMPGRHWDYVHHRAQHDAPTGRETTAYLYGLGYPAIGALFIHLGFGGDPFVVPDGLLFALCAALTLALARKFLNPTAALLATGLLILTAPYVLYFVIPFGTTLTAVAVLVALNVACSDRRTIGIGVALGAAIGFCLAARYTDAIWPTLIVAPALLRSGRRALPVIVPVCALVLVALGTVLWSQWSVFGSPWTTPYHFHHGGLDSSLQAFHLGAIPNAAMGVFVTGDRHLLFGVQPILRGMPWVVLAPIGLVVLIRRRARHWQAMCVASAVAVAASAYYFANYFGGTPGLRSWNIRFHIAWFPIWAILAAIAIRAIVNRATGTDPAKPTITDQS
jgi:hypothetical protein